MSHFTESTGEPAAERGSLDEVLLLGRLRQAVYRLNPAIPPEALAKVARPQAPTLSNRASVRASGPV